MYVVRNKVPDPAVSYTELGWNKEGCSRTVRGTTNLRVFDDAADKCREYTTIVAEQDLIDADRFTAFYPLVGRSPGGILHYYNYDITILIRTLPMLHITLQIRMSDPLKLKYNNNNK